MLPKKRSKEDDNDNDERRFQDWEEGEKCLEYRLFIGRTSKGGERRLVAVVAVHAAVQ